MARRGAVGEEERGGGDRLRAGMARWGRAGRYFPLATSTGTWPRRADRAPGRARKKPDSRTRAMCACDCNNDCYESYPLYTATRALAIRLAHRGREILRLAAAGQCRIRPGGHRGSRHSREQPLESQKGVWWHFKKETLCKPIIACNVVCTHGCLLHDCTPYPSDRQSVPVTTRSRRLGDSRADHKTCRHWNRSRKCDRVCRFALATR